jgi:hypothetical protein
MAMPAAMQRQLQATARLSLPGSRPTLRVEKKPWWDSVLRSNCRGDPEIGTGEEGLREARC